MSPRWLLVVCFVPAPVSAADPGVPLATALAVRRLHAADAAKRHPVRIVGVVTHAGPGGDFFVQDGTAGIYVHPVALPRPLTAGDCVVVAGVTDAGAFAPCVDAAVPGSVTVTGRGEMPEPEPYDLVLDDSRWLDARFVSVRARVVSAAVAGGHTTLSVATVRGTGTVRVPGAHPAGAAALVGRCVRVRGVVVPGFGAARGVDGPPTILAAALPAAEPGPDPHPARVPVLAELGHFTPEPGPVGRRVTVRGTVAAAARAADGKTLLFVQDATAGVKAVFDGDPGLAPGAAVELTGTLVVRRTRLVLRDAAAAPDPTPSDGPGAGEPVAATVADLAAGRFDARACAVEATVADARQLGPDLAALHCVGGPVRFDVLFAGPCAGAGFDRVHAGDRVRLTGVPTDAHPGGLPPGGFTLWVRTPADVAVVARAPAPWYASPWLWALVGLVTVGGAAWVIALRVRVRSQQARIADTEAQERATEARYRDLFDAARDAVWELGPDGAVVAVNPAAARLFGLPPERVVGRPVADFLLPADSAALAGSAVRRADAPFEVTVVPATADPPRSVELGVRARPDGRVLVIARDVTERKRMQERAERGQRLEAIGRLAGGIAHDFNNLLTVINGNAEHLALGPDPAARDLANQILDAGGRAAALTRQLLTFGRRRFVDPAPVDLAAAVAGTVDLLRRLVPDRVTLAVGAAPDTPWVLADPAMVEQVVMNLALNARDATPGGGTITVSTARADAGRTARLRVTDTGTGMDAATQARLFEPFFTTKPVGQGTGLGLATVYGIAQSLGAAVRFESAPGHGTTFDVDFPALSAPPARPGPAAPGPTRLVYPDGRPPVVLVAEDDDGVRDLARSILENAGCRVLTADGAAAALAAADAAGPIDLLLTDVVMPHADGRELAATLRARRPGLPVVFMSGHPGDVAEPFADAEYLAKPFTAAALADKVRRALGMPYQ